MGKHILSRFNGVRPENFFVASAVTFGFALTLLTAPLQAPDEPAHLLRIWQLSEGRVIADRYGGTVPASIGELINHFEPLKVSSAQKTTASEILCEFHRPLMPDRRLFILFANTAIYSPVPYLPQTAVMCVSKRFLLPPIALMYLARCGNVIAYALIGWLTLQTLPVLKWATCLVLLSPLPLFLAGSLSADPLTTGFCFLATASILRVSLESSCQNKTLLVLALSVVCLALCKWAYAPVLLLLLAIPPKARGSGWKRITFTPLLFSASVIVILVWSAMSHPMQVPLRGGDPQQQLRWVEAHPIGYVCVLFNTMHTQTLTVIWSSIGILGRLEVKLSPGFVGGYLLLIVWTALNDLSEKSPDRAMRTIAAAVVLSSALLVSTCVYLAWTSPRNTVIEGIQGRYFIPLALPLMIVMKCRGTWSIPPAVLQAAMVGSCVYTLITVWLRYF